MKKNKQQIEGNNNIQIGVNHGDIIHTERIIKKTEATPDPIIHISEDQAFTIKEKVNELVSLRCKVEDEEKSKIYAKVYVGFREHFRITGYKFLPKDRFEEAIRWFELQKVLKYRPKLRKADNEEYRKQLYKSIHAKANELKMSREDLYILINDLIVPKNPITSLKELSDIRLKKVYNKIFSMKS